jgi:hypothetical protein
MYDMVGKLSNWKIVPKLFQALILDCRSFVDFNNGHVENAANVWCSKLLNRRLLQNKVSN